MTEAVAATSQLMPLQRLEEVIPLGAAAIPVSGSSEVLTTSGSPVHHHLALLCRWQHRPLVVPLLIRHRTGSVAEKNTGVKRVLAEVQDSSHGRRRSAWAPAGAACKAFCCDPRRPDRTADRRRRRRAARAGRRPAALGQRQVVQRRFIDQPGVSIV